MDLIQLIMCGVTHATNLTSEWVARRRDALGRDVADVLQTQQIMTIFEPLNIRKSLETWYFYTFGVTPLFYFAEHSKP